MRTVVLAAALTALAELALQRIGTPIASHVPSAQGASGVAELVRQGGELAAGATAALVIAAAVALVLSARRTVAVPVAAALALSLLAGVLDSSGARVALHLAVIVAAAAVALAAGRVHRGIPILAFGLLAVAIGAGQWPLLLQALGVRGGAPAARTVAELAFVAAPILLATALLGPRRPHPAAWPAAAAAGLAVAGSLLLQPEHAAIVALWSTGATLALPPLLYVASAAAAALLVVDWLADPSRRHRAAGLALLFAAGVQPTLVHHDMTAIVGLLVLTLPSLQPPIRAER